MPTRKDSKVSADATEWRWASSEGVITPIDEWELVHALARGMIAPEALVWRPGWAEWLPACQVPELASAVPAPQRRAAVEPRRTTLRSYPPALPANGSAPPPASPARTSKPPPPPRRSSTRSLRSVKATLPIALRPASLDPAAEPDGRAEPSKSTSSEPVPGARAPLPTLADLEGHPATGTLRPPGAVPPPPRAVPPPPSNFEVLDELPELTPTSVQRAELGFGTATPIPSAVTYERQPLSERAPFEPKTQPSASPTPLPPRYEDGPAPIVQPDVTPSFRARPTLPPARLAAASSSPASDGRDLRASGSPAPRHYTWLLLGLAALSAVLGAALVVVLLNRPAVTSHGVTAVATPQAAALPAPTALITSSAPLAAACKVTADARRIAPILGSVTPVLTPIPSSSRIAVGFAAAQKQAGGVVLELPTLKVSNPYTHAADKPISGVVPIQGARGLTFLTDVEDADLRGQRTVAAPAQAPFTLGVQDQGLVLKPSAGGPRVIWPGELGDRLTDLRVASLGAGHAVTFRQGGQNGRILFGWLAPDGSKRSALAPIAHQGGLFGTPSVGQNGAEALIAYAWRPNTDVYWSIQLARAEPGSAPARSVQFMIPPGGPGAEAISPAVTGLPGSRWLVQWSEGSTGARQVRAQVLGRDLTPVGKAVTLSRTDQNAGQGALAAQGAQALALFLVSKAGGHELWGSALSCP